MKMFLCFLLVSIAIAGAQEIPKMSAGGSSTNVLDKFTLGQPRDNIRVGISKEPMEGQTFVCLFYVGRTNSNQLWIAPPKFQRAEYFLYDSSHKPVPYAPTYHPPGKTYKNISEVPKNVFNVHEGTMSSPFRMPYDVITLTNVFELADDGNYTLVAKARIMKINSDGSLSLVSFPQASLTVHVDRSSLAN
jgi:hypothetical protein